MCGSTLEKEMDRMFGDGRSAKIWRAMVTADGHEIGLMAEIVFSWQAGVFAMEWHTSR